MRMVWRGVPLHTVEWPVFWSLDRCEKQSVRADGVKSFTKRIPDSMAPVHATTTAVFLSVVALREMKLNLV